MSYKFLFEELSSASRIPSGDVKDPELSDEQNKALNAPFNSSAIICAGAGAGKTKLLVKRVSRLIKAGANPKRIAVVTFTRKAAAEVATRARSFVGKKAEDVFFGTVHALALSVLSRKGRTTELISEEQELAFVESLCSALPPDFEGLSTKELLLLINRVRESEKSSTLESFLAGTYEELLELHEVEDFTALLSKGARSKSDQYDHVLVDEAQDLSSLQLRFLRAVGPNAKFWFIGDPDQAIYGFRGSEPSMMHRLRDETEGLYYLSTNYRCATRVVSCANYVIQGNAGRFDIEWKAARADAGIISVKPFNNGEAELACIADWLQEAPKTRCVLGRTQALVAQLKEAGLPAYTVHESKGLEWDEVWVMGCEAGLFPHPLARREEERRLFYVAMTRAKNALTLSYCESRSTLKNPDQPRHPSPFLYEVQALLAKT